MINSVKETFKVHHRSPLNRCNTILYKSLMLVLIQ